ncbi:MAG: hypothetical protein J1F38_03185 [Muribaculaceae bacterium]|nr:hypothetical protein [Muribaculaceae bacterium]
MKKIKTGLLTIGLMALGLLSSCVETEVVDPAKGESEETTLILNLSRPASIETRADVSQYKLRYVAKLFAAATDQGIDSPLQRKEIAGDDKSENGESDQIIFKVDAGKSYVILVFADYIPKESTADGNGYYKDYFYNTDVARLPKNIQMNLSPGKSISDGNETISQEFFNNDNYDCFYGKTEFFDKESAEKVINLTLKRQAAKVILRDKGSESGDLSVSISKATVGYQHEMVNSKATTYSFNVNATITKSLTAADRDLLYFYTLSEETGNQLAMNLKVNNGDPITINNIPVKRNYQTIVKGTFLEVASDDSQGQGGETTPTKDGNIILNLTTDNSWESTPMTKE